MKSTFRTKLFIISILCTLLVGVGLLLSACDGDLSPADTDITTVSPTTDTPTDNDHTAPPTDPALTDSGTNTPTEDIPTEDIPTEDTPTEDTPTEDTPTEDTPSDDTTAGDSEGGEVMTLPPPTVPEPEPTAQTMPRLDIYTDDGGDVTSKDIYKHGTATMSQCHEKFAFESVGVNIRARGNSTFYAPKKPFRLKFDQKQEMLGLNGGKAYKSWVLLADYYDGSMLRTFGTFKFAKALMENKYYSSDCTHVELYLNGEYRGVYLLCEQTQINRGRVDLPEMAEGDTSVEQGYLMVGVGGQTDEPELIHVYPDITVRDRTGRELHFGGINFTLSGGTYTQEQKDYVSRYVSSVYKVVAKAVYENEYYDLARDGTMTRKTHFEWAKTAEEKQIETISAVFNLEAAVSMCILDEICKNLDAMAFNMYVDLSPEGDGVLTLAAPWDFDFSMANTHYSTTHSYTGFYATNLSESEGIRVNMWYVMLGSIPWFEEMVKEHWQENYVELRTVVSEMATVNNGYDAAFNRDWERWGAPIHRSLIHHHAQADLAAFNKHADAGNLVTNWLTLRLRWLNKQWGDGTMDDEPIAPAAPELELVFEDQDDMALINGIKRANVELTDGNGLLLTPGVEEYDPYFSFDYDLLGKQFDAMQYPILEFTYKITRSSSKRTYISELFLCSGHIQNATGGVSTSVEVTADGQWHTVRIDLSETGFWSGEIHEIRFDFFDSAKVGDKMYLKEFKLLPA